MCDDLDHAHTSPARPLRPFRIGTGQPQLTLPDEPSTPDHPTRVDGDEADDATGGGPAA